MLEDVPSSFKLLRAERRSMRLRADMTVALESAPESSGPGGRGKPGKWGRPCPSGFASLLAHDGMALWCVAAVVVRFEDAGRLQQEACNMHTTCTRSHGDDNECNVLKRVIFQVEASYFRASGWNAKGATCCALAGELMRRATTTDGDIGASTTFVALLSRAPPRRRA